MQLDPALPFHLLVPARLYDQMVAHAVAELPIECCGLLAGTVRDGIANVTQWLPLVNVLQSRDEFESEPKSLLAAHRTMRSTGSEIVAVYHSHPMAAPLPSRKDRERNYSEQVVSIIIGLNAAEPEVRAWWLTATAYRPAALTICQPS